MTNEAVHVRRQDEEATLPREIYFTDAYFSPPQLDSLCQQIVEVRKSRAATVLEIGKGNGFVSSFLRAGGLSVTTVDINPALEPDVVGDVRSLDEVVPDAAFDCVLCAEVLEHLPFDDLDQALRSLRQVTSGRCIVTLPRADPLWFGLDVSCVLPRLGRRRFVKRFYRPVAQPTIYPGHYWEINSHEYTTLANLRKIFLEHFSSVRDYRFDRNLYHHFFVLGV